MALYKNGLRTLSHGIQEQTPVHEHPLAPTPPPQTAELCMKKLSCPCGNSTSAHVALCRPSPSLHGQLFWDTQEQRQEREMMV